MKLFKIEAGTFHVDGGAAFGVVPKRVWQKRYPADENNFCQITMRCLLIDTGDRRILVDTGAGDKQLDYLKYYGFKEVANFDIELEKIGYTAHSITDVVFTHLHFDHCGGATRYSADKSSVELVFPQATHWVGRAQWENFLEPNVREADSYFKENMDVIYQRGQLKLVDSDMKLTDDVEFKIYNGHTAGQIAVYLTKDEKTLVYCGDVIPTAANVPVAWISAYDVFPLDAMIDKEKMLSEAAAKNQVLMFEHDAYNECCLVEKQYNKYKVKKTLRFDEVFGS